MQLLHFALVVAFLATPTGVACAEVQSIPAIADQSASRWSAQCLSEIAALTGDRVDFRDAEFVYRAQSKATQLAEAFQAGTEAITRSMEATDAAIFALEQQEAAGEVPRGAASIQADIDDATTLAGIAILSNTRVPSCGFSKPEPMTMETLRDRRDARRAVTQPLG